MSEAKLYHPFQCSAQVQATEMTLGDYNRMRGWELPANEFEDTQGFHVLYLHGVEVTYQTWWPRAQFEQLFLRQSTDVGGGVTLPTVNEQGLALYACHKQVFAGRILFMARDDENKKLMLHVGAMSNILAVPLAFLERHQPEIGGYYVKYQDGYESYSPAQAFEAGYSLAPTH